MSIVGGEPARRVPARGTCPRCYRYVDGWLIRTVDERHELVGHDNCPGEPRREVRARTYNG